MEKEKEEVEETTEESAEPEVVVEESEEIPGGIQTTDPSFADGAQEVDSYSNQPNK